MGISARFYIWDESKGFMRFSMKGFHKSYDGLPNKDLIEYSGKSIKSVLMYLKMENRKPVEIIRIDSVMHNVDKDGVFNQEEVTETRRLAMESLVTPEMGKLYDDMNSKVIWSSGIFAIKKYKALYSWELTESQLDQLNSAVFKVA